MSMYALVPWALLVKLIAPVWVTIAPILIGAPAGMAAFSPAAPLPPVVVVTVCACPVPALAAADGKTEVLGSGVAGSAVITADELRSALRRLLTSSEPSTIAATSWVMKSARRPDITRCGGSACAAPAAWPATRCGI